MTRLTTVVAISLVSALPVQAQEKAVVEGLPAETLVFDLAPATAEGTPTPIPAPLPETASDPVPSTPTAPLTITLEPATPKAEPTSTPTIAFEPAVVTPAASATVQAPASTRSPAIEPLALPPAESGTVLDPALAAGQIDLAPGEAVLQVIAAPSIVKVPATQPSYGLLAAVPTPDAEIRTAPEPKIDPVTGRLRDTPGWTGRSDGPASIGCFPAGSCAVLNQR